MAIRDARGSDWQSIAELLRELDYETGQFLEAKLQAMLEHPDERVLVYEQQNRVIAFLSLHFIPQIALAGDFARISYFAVDKEWRSRGVGREMEEFCVRLAFERNCDRMEVHSHARRTGAHKFYYRQGYEESPKYFIKKLSAGADFTKS